MISVFVLLSFVCTQVLAILYNGYQAAVEEPRLLGTVENQVLNAV